jgi:hypothetical protein
MEVAPDMNSQPHLTPANIPPDNVLSGVRPWVNGAFDSVSKDVWFSTPGDGGAVGLAEAPILLFGPIRLLPNRLWFDCSPGSLLHTPLTHRDIAGQRFLHVARQGDVTPLDGGSGIEIQVISHCGLSFAAGRQVELLTHEDGRQFVELIDRGEGAPADIPLPRGFRRRTITLPRDWITPLAGDCRSFFFLPQNRSFVGPVLNKL